MARPTSVNDALHQLDEADLDTTVGMREATDALAFLEEVERDEGLDPEVREVFETARAEVAERSRAMTGIGGPQTAETLAEATEAQARRASGDSDAATAARMARGQQVGPEFASQGGMPDAIDSSVRDALTPSQREAWQREVDRMVAMGMDPEEARVAADQMAMFGQLDEQVDEDPFIGVPQDHRFPVGPADPRLNFNLGGGQARQFARPRYRESDTERPYSMSSGQIAALQRRLVEAGLLSGEYRNGWYDAPTQNAYAQLLAFANQRGQRETQALDRLQSQWQQQQEEQREEARQEAMASFSPDPATLLEPDPAALRDQARSTLLAMGRRRSDIDPDELDQMVDVMSGEFKRQRELQTELARRQHVAQVESQFGDEPVAPDLSGLDMTDVDPMARFDEWFEGEFAGEIETRETSAEVARRGATFEQGLNQMRGAVRGGGA